MLISKCSKTDEGFVTRITEKQHFLSENIKQNIKQTNVDFSMCMSLYKSVNAAGFAHGYYKIGPLND